MRRFQGAREKSLRALLKRDDLSPGERLDATRQLGRIEAEIQRKDRAKQGKPALGRPPKASKTSHPAYSAETLAWLANEFPIHGYSSRPPAEIRDWAAGRLAQCVAARHLKESWDWDPPFLPALRSDFADLTFSEVQPHLDSAFDLLWLTATHDERRALPYSAENIAEMNAREQQARTALTDERAESIFDRLTA